METCMTLPLTADTVYADGPSANPSQPAKAMIRRLLRGYEDVLNAGLSNGGLIFDTKANLDADLAHPANASAWVVSDGANNGIYRKSGASGSGSWAKIADLPYSVIYAQNAGVGTANAVVATSSLPIVTTAYAQLISVPFVAENTGAMTIAVNGEMARSLVTNTGAAIPSGYVQAGMSALVQIDGDGNYRLFSYGDATAVQAAAEAAQTAAEDAQAAAEAAAASLIKRDTVALLVSDAVLAYSAGTGKTVVAAGQIIEAGGFRYEVAAFDATDHHVETAGGVKLYVQQPYHVEAFAALADGVKDDTAAWNKAVAAAVAGRTSLHVTGRVRVTGGYVQSVAMGDLHIVGTGRAHEWLTGKTGAQIILDNTDPASFFFKISNRMRLEARDITFACAQFVQDREFFWFDGTSYPTFSFFNVDFENVEMPLVFEAPSSVQNSSLINVQFRNSGTIHSRAAGTSDVNTQLLLLNVNHEGSVPVNADKVMCDLRGFRHISGENVTLEGSVPSNGDWTIMRFQRQADTYLGTTLHAIFENLYFEFSGNVPAALIDLHGGHVEINGLNDVWTALGSTKFKLTNAARLQIRATSKTNSIAVGLLSSFITVEDNKCAVRVSDSAISGFYQDEYRQSPPWLTFENCSDFSNVTTARFAYDAVFGNDGTRSLYRWGGGYIDDNDASISVSGGTAWTPSTDATYGRKLVITPSAGKINATIGLSGTKFVVGDQLVAAMLVKLPTYSTGVIRFGYAGDASLSGGITNFDATHSGQIVQVRAPVRLQTALTGSFSINIGDASGAVVTDQLEIYALEIFAGGRIPKVDYRPYPKNIVTWGTAAPTTGAWKQGDMVQNSTPSAGGPEGWICVSTGSPGTWAAFGNSRLENTATYDPPSLAAGVVDTPQTMTVTGAALGDFVDVSFSVALAGARLEAWVSGANTVSYRFSNPTGSAIDLTSGTVKARVRK